MGACCTAAGSPGSGLLARPDTASAIGPTGTGQLNGAPPPPEVPPAASSPEEQAPRASSAAAGGGGRGPERVGSRDDRAGGAASRPGSVARAGVNSGYGAELRSPSVTD